MDSKDSKDPFKNYAMKILFITHHFLTGTGGGVFASKAYINAFAKNSTEMKLLYPIKDKAEKIEDIDQNIKLCPISYSKPKWKKFLDLLIGRVHRYYHAVPQLLTEEKFDIVVFDNSKTSFRLIDIAHQYGSKVVVIHHNFEYEYVRDNSTGILRSLQLFWTKRYERDATLKSDLNLTLTKQDADLLCKAFNGNKNSFKLLGTFEFVPYVAKMIKNDGDSKNRFVITGNLSAMQTEHSLLKWLKDYYPILKDCFPSSSLTIAGKNPSQAIQRQCSNLGIRLIPSPESMDDVLQDADFYICPTELGGGLKLRVMDGLRWGLPVVTHKVSARGYDLFEEKGILLSYSNKIEFKNALLTFSKMKIDKQKVIDMYQNIFSFAAGVKRVKELIESLKK